MDRWIPDGLMDTVWMAEAPLSSTVSQRCRRDAVEKKGKKKDQQKKSSRSVYVPKFGSYFAFLIFKNHAHCHQNEKPVKKVLLLVGSHCADISTSP